MLPRFASVWLSPPAWFPFPIAMLFSVGCGPLFRPPPSFIGPTTPPEFLWFNQKGRVGRRTVLVSVCAACDLLLLGLTMVSKLARLFSISNARALSSVGRDRCSGFTGSWFLLTCLWNSEIFFCRQPGLLQGWDGLQFLEQGLTVARLFIRKILFELFGLWRAGGIVLETGNI